MRLSIRLLGIVVLCVFALQAQAQIEVPHVFEPGTTARASEVNANFDALEAAAAENADGVATNANSIAGSANSVDENFESIGENSSAISTLQGEVILNTDDIENLVADNNAPPAATLSAPAIIDNTPIGPNNHTPGLTINAGSLDGNNTYALALNQTDKDRLGWLFSSLGALSHGSLIIDARFNASVDPDTKVVNVSSWPYIVDPDGPGTLATMLQVSADVETSLILKGNFVSVNGREPKLLLALDKEEDWVFKIGNEGDVWWGDPQQKGKDSWDVKLERVEDLGFEYARFVLDADNFGNEVVVDIKAPLVQGTGAPTHGPAYWAVSDGDSFDHGDGVCQEEGLSCQNAIEFSTMADPTQSSCGTAHAVGTTFIAFCK